jgi:hypothetical protein
VYEDARKRDTGHWVRDIPNRPPIRVTLNPEREAVLRTAAADMSAAA